MHNEEIVVKPRPPYLFGLLCLIPLVGGLVGVVMLLYGIIKYKDKWFALIGIFGILFTIGVYSSLFYFMKNGKPVRNSMEKMSQEHLKNVVPFIEFYNLQYGHYPDSLKELSANYTFVLIYDPLQSFRVKGGGLYNYKRINNKYILFSSGKDGIPNTKDDLYPKLVIKDSTKIGIILPK